MIYKLVKTTKLKRFIEDSPLFKCRLAHFIKTFNLKGCLFKTMEIENCN